MKLILTGWGIFVLLILWSSSLNAVSINWGTAGNPLYCENGVGSERLEEGDVVQLICDRGRDGINPPAMNGLPSGDDVLIHTSQIGHGSFFPGEFSDNITTGSVTIGDFLYVRAWNDSSLLTASRWGDTRQHTPQEWVVDNSLFFTMNVTENGSWATIGYRLKAETRVFEAKRMREVTDPGRALILDRGSVVLHPPSPNPFKYTTWFRFRISGVNSRLALSLSVYDIRGNLIRSLSRDERSDGEYKVCWDGTDSFGLNVSSGVYLVRLEVAEGQKRRSLVVKLVRAE